MGNNRAPGLAVWCRKLVEGGKDGVLVQSVAPKTNATPPGWVGGGPKCRKLDLCAAGLAAPNKLYLHQATLHMCAQLLLRKTAEGTNWIALNNKGMQLHQKLNHLTQRGDAAP